MKIIDKPRACLIEYAMAFRVPIKVITGGFPMRRNRPSGPGV